MRERVYIVSYEHEKRLATGALVVIASSLLFFALRWLWDSLNNWQALDIPYRYCAAFYYYTIVVPLDVFAAIWKTLGEVSITPYPNLNICIAIAVALAMVFLVAWIITRTSLFLRRRKFGLLKQSTLVASPAIISLGYFLLSAGYAWLFTVG